MSAGFAVLVVALGVPRRHFRARQVHPESARWARDLRVPGFEDWQTVAVSQSGDIEIILANPVTIDAY